jgi:hypothetical protein
VSAGKGRVAFKLNRRNENPQAGDFCLRVFSYILLFPDGGCGFASRGAAAIQFHAVPEFDRRRSDSNDHGG